MTDSLIDRMEPTAMSITDLRDFIAEATNRVRYGKERIVLTRHGRDVAALVPIEDLRKLEAIDHD
jgi:prevent-host-death family protein